MYSSSFHNAFVNIKITKAMGIGPLQIPFYVGESESCRGMYYFSYSFFIGWIVGTR